MLQLTDNALRQLRELLSTRESGPETGLRVSVERGGCAGMQYSVKIDQARPGDDVVEREGVALIVDRESAAYLDGSELDYVDNLADSGFKIHNPNAARSCGCGSSFEPAAATAHDAGPAAASPPEPAHAAGPTRPAD